MWLKIMDDSYIHAVTGAKLQAQPLETKARVLYSGPFGNVTVQSGFESVEDAQEALDNYMEDQGFDSISLPETEDTEPNAAVEEEEDTN